MLVVTGRHRPHEVLFLGFSAVTGAAFVAGAKPPGTLESLMDLWVLWTWYGLLLASGVVGLISFLLSDLYRALVYERAAMVGHVTAPTMYGVALLATGQATALFAGAFCLTWAAASGWRCWQVQQDIRSLRRMEKTP
ncbi:hypothetical protein O7626_31340 [Micromonospora sp. WMMD1102]|uniref:hypothetical protein n=1 Tax=Micromonospora sp. WMMD1102 TaxID=3016105 RepID=UPI00241582FB|nr:hypothetical protein [Micromonospora sp. WMMD1102]MDG4790363.1 hypothetical protein [Micromonospora sp. WMMD1102]